ncbi:MAG: PIN domain-containing protein [Actinomycetota bacterium]
MLADSSAAVAAFAPWHESHDAVVRALGRGAGIVAHAAVETYSVLTRLPPPYRAPASVVAEFLEARFGRRWRGLPEAEQRATIASLPGLGIEGGATYDALIAAAAVRAGAALVSCDERALRVYAAIGAEVDLIA